jgi:ribosomal protein L7/L12
MAALFVVSGAAGVFVGEIVHDLDITAPPGTCRLLNARRVLRCASPDELAVQGFVARTTTFGPTVPGVTELFGVTLVHPVVPTVAASLQETAPVEAPAVDAPVLPPAPTGSMVLHVSYEQRGLGYGPQKIPAIKVLREMTGWGLKETKEFVEVNGDNTFAIDMTEIKEGARPQTMRGTPLPASPEGWRAAFVDAGCVCTIVCGEGASNG